MRTLAKLAGFGLGIMVAGGPGAAQAGPPLFPDEQPVETARQPGAPRTLRIPAGRQGHFFIDGKANDSSFRFMIDTGSSGIAFDTSHARRLGIDVSRLRWDGSASTANGVIRTASIRLTSLTIGPFTFKDVPASIGEGEVSDPLLGMTILRQLNIAISNGLLTLSSAP